MRVLGLTDRGVGLAQNRMNPKTPKWRVIYFLDRAHKATDEQIRNYTQIPSSELSSIIKELKRDKVVAEE